MSVDRRPSGAHLRAGLPGAGARRWERRRGNGGRSLDAGSAGSALPPVPTALWSGTTRVLCDQLLLWNFKLNVTLGQGGFFHARRLQVLVYFVCDFGISVRFVLKCLLGVDLVGFDFDMFDLCANRYRVLILLRIL